MAEAKASLRYARISPRKARLVADLVRGYKVQDAVDTLRFTRKKAADMIREVLMSAVANAEDSGSMDVDTLYVSRIWVDEGPTAKRFMPRAHGRATRIRKRTCHINVVLAEQ